MKSAKCLDHGLVRLVDSMGDDASIVQAARVSYGDGTKTVREDNKLIDYLVRNKHTSPLEMVEFKFHIKAPLFVARQWMRHRTASINECSARYSVLPNCYYVPDLQHINPQSDKNKQCRDQEAAILVSDHIAEQIAHSSEQSYRVYESMLRVGVARELARMVLPVNFYTEWYWKIDLHNLLHFLRLRMHEHAQYEIRVYAEAIAEMVKDITPAAYASFDRHFIASKGE